MKSCGGQIYASVKAAEDGTVTVTATSGKAKVGSAQAKVTGGKTVVLDLSPTKAAKAQLAKRHLRVTLKVTFKNAAGETSTVTKAVTL